VIPTANNREERHLPISRARKEELVARYVGLLKESNGFVLVQTQGLSVPQIEQMRKIVREQNGVYAVAKNNLIRKALEQADWVVPENLLKGPVSVVFGRDNMPGVSKAVLKYIKDEGFEEKMKVTGGVMTGDVLSSAQITTVSELPTLDELRAQLAGLVISPAQGIVNVLYQATGGVVNVLQAYLDKKDEG
jgi:large subunit ribosomal protein L10